MPNRDPYLRYKRLGFNRVQPRRLEWVFYSVFSIACYSVDPVGHSKWLNTRCCDGGWLDNAAIARWDRLHPIASEPRANCIDHQEMRPWLLRHRLYRSHTKVDCDCDCDPLQPTNQRVVRQKLLFGQPSRVTEGTIICNKMPVGL
jgi:hypothetical protein